MRVKLFTLRYSESLGGFDERPLDEFARDKELLAFREHFFAVNEVPHLVCIVTWQACAIPTSKAERSTVCASEEDRTAPVRGDVVQKRARKADPLEALDEPQRVLFQTLRVWRAQKARVEGVPPYVVFTNRELVAIIQRLPDSSNALGNLPGIGKGKVGRYGDELLSLLPNAKPTESGEATPAKASS